MFNPRPLKQAHLWLGKRFSLVVERPIGSVHPKHPSITYALNYGYVPETLAADGCEIDAYILGIDKPIVEFEGICIAMIHRKNDVGDKLVLASYNEGFTCSKISRLTAFQEQFFQCEIIR